MDQTDLDFASGTAESADDAGFTLGWDHARHGLVPDAALLIEGTPIGQGWRAGRAVFGTRTLAATRHVRGWLALRTAAWRQGIAFETLQVTPNYLAQIEATHCPVTRRALGPADGDAPVVTRLREGAGYAAGVLAVLSERGAAANAGLGAAQALRRAGRIDAGIEPAAEGLSPDAHGRAAVLASFVTPLAFAECVRIPLRVLPPNRVRLLNAVQGLQAVVTMLFAAPGWSSRVRAFADRLGDADRRLEFNLFVGAMAPRLAAANADARTVADALEDAWTDARVNRRWQAFALALGEARVGPLLESSAAAGLVGKRTLVHAPEQAVDGWALASRGRVLPRARRAAALRPPAPVAGDALRG